MTYPNIIAKLTLLHNALPKESNPNKRKKIKDLIRRLTNKKEAYELAYYGKVIELGELK